MKILMLLESDFPPDDRVEKEAISLIAEGYSVTIACYTFEKSYDERWYKGIRIIKKPISSFIYKSSVGALRFRFYFIFWQSFLEKLLKAESFDVIHIHDLPLAKIGDRIKRKFNIKLVLDLHENYPASLKTTTHTKKVLGRLLHSDIQWQRYEIKYIRKADLLICVVDEMKERIIKLGAKREKIVVLENTPSLNDFEIPDKSPSSEFITIFYVGGINIYRGLQIVIKALPAVVKEIRNIRFWVVGNGSYLPDIQNLIQKLHLNEYVIFFGWKNTKEIANLLSQSDIAIIPHLKSEQTDCSSPNKIYQYAFSNKAIMCSNCNSLIRLINEWGNGVVYQHDSPEDLGKKLISFVKSGDYKLLGNKGQINIKNKYNWDMSVIPLLKAYKKLQS